MLQIKVFDEQHESDLQAAVNTFLEEVDEKDVKDIQFQVATAEDTEDNDHIYCFSAIVVYRKS